MASKRARYPLRVFDRSATVAIFDAEDREVVLWTGFDGSRIGLEGARVLAHELVDAANAAALRRAEPTHSGERGEPNRDLRAYRDLCIAEGRATDDADTQACHHAAQDVAVRLRAGLRARPAGDVETLVLKLRTEVNCRREHGADGGEHLRYIEDRLDELLAALRSRTVGEAPHV